MAFRLKTVPSVLFLLENLNIGLASILFSIDIGETGSCILEHDGDQILLSRTQHYRLWDEVKFIDEDPLLYCGLC